MTTKEFLEKITGDEALCRKLAATETAEAGYAVAKEAGVTDDFETFAAAVGGNELSDEALGHVAGGTLLFGGPKWLKVRSDLSRLMSR